MTTTSKDSNVTIEAPRTIKNFKSSTEVENLYRFIFENNLRREAHMALELVVNSMKKAKKGTRGRKKAVKQ